MLERAFFAAWAIICPKQIDAGSTRETELRSELTRCIQKLAAKGFVDSDVDQAVRGRVVAGSARFLIRGGQGHAAGCMDASLACRRLGFPPRCYAVKKKGADARPAPPRFASPGIYSSPTSSITISHT